MAGMNMSMTWTGLSELTEKLTVSQAEAVPLLASAIYEDAELMMTAAKERTPVGGGEYSPYDKAPGTLRASGHVDAPKIAGTTIDVTLGFGGAATSYAMVQHEHGEFHHVVGQADFLGSVVMEGAAGYGDRLAARLAGKLL